MSGNIDTNEDRRAYPLNRDLLASARLNLQHHLWIMSLGYLLHPSIPLNESTRIAEIGCGTGIWSLELAKQLPNGAEIEAFHLSLAQCPPKEWWPTKVTFNELDISNPIPDRLVGKYNVVYIRHFLCVLQSGNPMTLLSALLNLVKPGGYVQWQEWDIQTNKLVVAGSADSAAAAVAPKMKAFMDSTRGPKELQEQTKWISNFHARFSDTGAELIAHDRRLTAKEAIMLKQEVSFMSAREWIDNRRAQDSGCPKAARLEKLTDEAYDECSRLQRGTLIDAEMVTWVARKK